MMLIFIRNTDSFTVQQTFPPLTPTQRRLPGFRMPDGQSVYLIDTRPVTTPLFEIPVGRSQFSVPLLKSNLQKAIRRKERNAALRTAWWLLCREPTELLRRLPVILCEDTQAEPRLFTELVWLMAATSKGYRLLWSDAAWIMAAVATALETTGCWNLSVSVSSGKRATTFSLGLANPFVLALHIRVAYGGMPGDVAFLGRLRDRAANGRLPLWTGPIVWLEEDIPWLDPDEDILLEAVDQHTYPRILEAIPGLRPEAIWYCRSSVNVRTYVGDGAETAETYVVGQRTALQPNLEKHALALELFSRRMRRRVERVEAAEEQDLKTATAASVATLDRWIVKN